MPLIVPVALSSLVFQAATQATRGLLVNFGTFGDVVAATGCSNVHI